MPATIPSNCFARRELHTLISRAHQLARQADADMAEALVALARKAADIDGRLADLAQDEATLKRHKDVLANPYGWEAVWVENSEVVHGDDAKFVIRMAQQLLRRSPQDYVVTGRFRVTLDDRTYHTTDPRELRGHVTAYLERVGCRPALTDHLLAFVGAD